MAQRRVCRTLGLIILNNAPIDPATHRPLIVVRAPVGYLNFGWGGEFELEVSSLSCRIHVFYP